MQTRTRVVAVLTAGALGLAGCTSGDAQGDDTQPETTVAGTVTETTSTDTTAADTSTTQASTDTTVGGAATDTTLDGGADGDVAGIDLDALDSRFDQLADQVGDTGNDALRDAWDELETRYEDVRGAVESGDFAGVSPEEVSGAIEGFQETIDQNLDGLDPELVQGWNDLVSELEAVIPAISG